MKKIILSMTLTLLCSFNLMAAVSPIPAQECSVLNRPSNQSSTPRPVLGSNTYGKDARQVLQLLMNTHNYQTEVSSDLFGDSITSYILDGKQDLVVDSSYPYDGCRFSATLKTVCIEYTGLDTVKCGNICQFTTHCIDNR